MDYFKNLVDEIYLLKDGKLEKSWKWFFFIWQIISRNIHFKVKIYYLTYNFIHIKIDLGEILFYYI